jgi:hypothetical protein
MLDPNELAPWAEALGRVAVDALSERRKRRVEDFGKKVQQAAHLSAEEVYKRLAEDDDGLLVEIVAQAAESAARTSFLSGSRAGPARY